MRSVKNPVLVLVSAAGLAAGALADQVGVSKPDAARPYGSAVAPVRADRPAFDEAAYEAAKRHGQDVILARRLAGAPAVEAGRTPNFNYLRGQPVPKRLRADEIGLLLEAQGTKAEVIAAGVAAAKAAGLAVAEEGHRAMNSWAMIKLAKPAGDSAGMYNLIEQTLKTPGVRVAAPIFDNAFIDGGYYMPTDEVLARVRPGLDVAETLNTHALGFEVSNPNLGGMERAVTLRSTLRNGFDILRRANELYESGAFEWSTPSTLETMHLDVMTPNDPEFVNQWVHRNTGQDWIVGGSTINGLVGFDMDTDRAWDITTGKSTVRVFVMDSGVQSSHPDLNFYDGRDFTTGAVAGVGTGQPGTCDDHGTAVAGCAAGIINNGNDVAGTAGSCQVMSGKIGDQDVSPCASTFAAYSNSWLVNALAWGATHGAKITNASIGVGQDDAVEAEYTLTFAQGLLHFASAGNGGSDSVGDNGSGFPGSAPNTISVIAVDADGTKSGFSNFGTNCDLCAGGTAVRTTDRTGSVGYASGDLTYFGGTSAASPVAAGVGLLFFSQFGFATPSQARTAIFNSCTDIGAAGTDTTYQRGHINAYGALKENAPSNDDCANPLVISPNGGNLVFIWNEDTTWATPSRLEPNPSCTSTDQNSVFFSFTADHDGDALINTATSDYDTVLSVFDGCPTFNSTGTLTSSPTELGCDDDANGTTQSQVTLHLDAGQRILIRVSQFGATSGGGAMHLDFRFNPTAPSNDSCGNAIVIDDPESGNFAFNPPVYDTFFATSAACEPTEACGSSSGNSASVYYKFIPEHDGQIDVDTMGSSYDTVLSIHSGCTTQILQLPPNPPLCRQPSHLACNDDSGGQLQSSIQNFAVEAGRTYLIEVSRFGNPTTNVARLLDFNFGYTRTVPPNNNCSTATEVPGANSPGQITNYSNTQDTYYAVGGLCDPYPGCLPAGRSLYHSVWYTFTPEFTGRINASTAGSAYDTVMTIQSGCRTTVFLNGNLTCIGRDTQLACNDDVSIADLTSRVLNFSVHAGTTYNFFITSFNQFTPTSNSNLTFNLQYEAQNCVADFNGDGDLNSDDLGDYITCYFTVPPCPDAEFNADGNVNADDLGDFITAYFAGC